VRGTKNRERPDLTTMTSSNWMEMSPSDWMSMTPSEWMNWAMSEWNRSYADWMNIMPPTWTANINPAGMRRGVWSPIRERQPERHHRERCRDCDSNSCECYCCINNADLAIYSYFGEQRVIPILIQNDRHREAQISLELSTWNNQGGQPAPVETVLLEPQTFTLPACGEQKVILAVRIFDVKTGENEGRDDLTAVANADREAQRQLRDVDDCLVATADLRLVGCDHRPLRFAVAILPRSCDPYQVSCGCTC
jgi:hypothetical protein